MNYFSDNLKFLRQTYNLKQTELADFLKVRPSNVNNWEKGTNYPKMDVLIEISKYMNVSIDDLVTKNISKIPFTKIKVLNKDFNEGTNGNTKSGTKFRDNENNSENIYNNLEEPKERYQESPEQSPFNSESKALMNDLVTTLKSAISAFTDLKQHLSTDMEKLYLDNIATKNELIEEYKSQLKELKKERSKGA